MRKSMWSPSVFRHLGDATAKGDGPSELVVDTVARVGGISILHDWLQLVEVLLNQGLPLWVPHVGLEVVQAVEDDRRLVRPLRLADRALHAKVTRERRGHLGKVGLRGLEDLVGLHRG